MTKKDTNDLETEILKHCISMLNTNDKTQECWDKECEHLSNLLAEKSKQDFEKLNKRNIVEK